MDENALPITESSSSTEFSLDTIHSYINSLFSNKLVVIGFFVVLFINIVILDIYFLSSALRPQLSPVTPRVSSLQSAQCPLTCMSEISQIKAFLTNSNATPSATSMASLAAGLIADITPTYTPTPTPTATPTLTPTPSPTPGQREYYIPLGQGWGSYSDWAVVPGMGATIDPANYGSIVKVYFEATVRIPTGNQTVYVRLYNANTFQSVASSDLTLSGGTSTLLTSQPIILNSGNNTYQVQLKTQLQYQTYIDQARIRIISR